MTHHLLGLYDSPYVRRVAIAMVYYGIPFEHESLSGRLEKPRHLCDW